MKIPLHKQLQGWDGFSQRGQAIYDAIGEQQELDQQAMENRNMDYDEVKANADTEAYFEDRFGRENL